MIGAKDLAFPKLNLASWYIYNRGALRSIRSAGGVDTGWTFYTPFSSSYTNTNVIRGAGHFLSPASPRSLPG